MAEIRLEAALRTVVVMGTLFFIIIQVAGLFR